MNEWQQQYTYENIKNTYDNYYDENDKMNITWESLLENLAKW